MCLRFGIIFCSTLCFNLCMRYNIKQWRHGTKSISVYIIWPKHIIIIWNMPVIWNKCLEHLNRTIFWNNSWKSWIPTPHSSAMYVAKLNLLSFVNFTAIMKPYFGFWGRKHELQRENSLPSSIGSLSLFFLLPVSRCHRPLRSPLFLLLSFSLPRLISPALFEPFFSSCSRSYHIIRFGECVKLKPR